MVSAVAQVSLSISDSADGAQGSSRQMLQMKSSSSVECSWGGARFRTSSLETRIWEWSTAVSQRARLVASFLRPQ